MPVIWALELAEPSELRECGRCQTDIWVGRSTLQGMAEEYPLVLPKFLCIPCMQKTQEDEITFALTKAQEVFLRQEVGDDAVDDLKRALGIEEERE